MSSGHTFEVMQRMIDDPLASCSTCGAPVQRVFHPVAVHFKGSGFYNTDYGKKKAGPADPAAKSVGLEVVGLEVLRVEVVRVEDVGLQVVRLEVLQQLVLD